MYHMCSNEIFLMQLNLLFFKETLINVQECHLLASLGLSVMILHYIEGAVVMMLGPIVSCEAPPPVDLKSTI